MAAYSAFDPNAEVSGIAFLAVMKALDSGQIYRKKLLEKHGLYPDIDRWYPIQAWLDFLKELEETVGLEVVYLVGRAVPDNAHFPAGTSKFCQALESIDSAYHANHRNGEIGCYKLVEFKPADRFARMLCHNPYPSEFDRGLLTTIVQKFRPGDSLHFGVHLDLSKPSRKEGGDSCTFIIRY